MTPEERLRSLLQVDDPPLSTDGLLQIRERLARRRSRVRPALAAAAAVAVAGVAAVTVFHTDASSYRPARHHDGVTDPRPTACADPACASPRPSPSTSASPSGVTTSGGGTPVWPFTTDREAAAWEAAPSARPWAADPVQVTQHLLDDYLEVPGRALPRVSGSAAVAVVKVFAGNRTVSDVRLERVGDAAGPWSVTGASSTDLVLTDPDDGGEVSSPLRVTGRVTGVDQSVHLRLQSRTLLAEAFAPAGRDQPWSQALTWSREDWDVAALTAVTFNGKGDLSAVAITAVVRDGSSGPAASPLVAIDQEHVVSVDPRTGTQLRQLSFPPAGSVDMGPDRGGSDNVVWVRVGPDSCTSSIILASLGRGPAGTTVEPKRVVRTLPALSAGGRSLGWVEQPCGGGEKAVLVRGPDARFSTVASTPEGVNDLDVRDDGWAVVQLGGQVRVLPPGAARVSDGQPLRADGCTLAAPAWEGATVLAWELCGDRWHLGRWRADGRLLSRGVAVPGMSLPRHTAVGDGQVLVALADHRLARLVGSTVIDIPNAVRWGQADW